MDARSAQPTHSKNHRDLNFLGEGNVLIRNSCWRFFGFAVLLSATGPQIAQAQALRFDQKYIESVKSSSGVTPVAIDSFGDILDLSSGSVQFRWTDIDIPGNNALPVRLQRTLTVEDKSHTGGGLGGFGPSGNIDLPYLKGIFPSNLGWQVKGPDPNARCSAPNAPPAVANGIISASDYWSGNRLHVPWAGDQAILTDPASVLPRPTGSAPLMTRNFWAFECKPSTKNGYPGEGFIAISPQGERYHFDWVVTRGYGGLSKRYGNYAHATASMVRSAVYFLVSKIEDRFGNWVAYTYYGDKLASITSSDGRSIQVTGWSDNRITAVSSSVGNWTYAYTGNTMTSTLPDGSHWAVTTSGLQPEIVPYPEFPLYSSGPLCPAPPLSTGDFWVSVTQPSGATATYDFDVQRHFKNNIPKYCNSFIDDSLLSYKYLTIPNFSDSFTLVSKEISGPGLSSMAWTYSYSGGGPLAFEDVCADPPSEWACAPTKNTIVRGPERSYRRYTFGNLYKVNSGQLMKVEEGRETGIEPNVQVEILRSTETEYMAPAQVATQAFPDRVGSPGSSRFDDVELASLRPVISNIIRQDSVDYSTQNSNFTVFARPQTAVKSSAPGVSKTDTTTFYNDTSLWVLGQVRRQATNGIETFETVYDPATALPISTESYGKFLQSFTYHIGAGSQSGTIATITDGNQNTTTLSNWKRGIPQAIGFADGAGISAVVDDDATLASVTDANGFVTEYQYDPMGRLARIDYPQGDSVSWLPTLQAFAPVLSAEYGIPAGHWRQTVSTGNARKLTYYDALWRPVLVREYDTANVAGTSRFTATAYDADGRVAHVTYPVASGPTMSNGAWSLPGVRTTYDALGRVTAVKQDSELGVLTTTTQYLAGFKRQTTDPMGNVTVEQFQTFDAPSYDAPTQIDAPENTRTTITRDVFGKPTAIQRGATN